MKRKEFYKRKDNRKTEVGISLPRHHLVHHRSLYLHYTAPQVRGGADEQRLRGLPCLETTPRSPAREDTARFTHPTSRGERELLSPAEIRKNVCSEWCHAHGGSQVSRQQFPTGRAETTGTNPQHTDKPFQDV